MLRIALLALLLVPGALSAATLKPYTRLATGVVHLSDLWDGVQDDKPLGPGPAPGQRIVVRAAQLAAIAHDFSVDWTASSSGDRVILERPARTLSRDDVLPGLRDALVRSGASPDAELELAGFTAPPMPADEHLEIAVGQLEFDKLSGRFSALLTVDAAEAGGTQVRVTGRMLEMLSLPVFQRRLNPGDTVAAADLAWARFPKNLARGDVARQFADAVGLIVRQPPSPNEPILLADLGRDVVVHKGDSMLVELASQGLALSARGTAVDQGALGDHIRVLNPSSQMTYEVQITGPGQGTVIPGTVRPLNRQASLR